MSAVQRRLRLFRVHGKAFSPWLEHGEYLAADPDGSVSCEGGEMVIVYKSGRCVLTEHFDSRVYADDVETHFPIVARVARLEKGERATKLHADVRRV